MCVLNLLCADAPLGGLAAPIGMCTLCLLWLLAVVACCGTLRAAACVCVSLRWLWLHRASTLFQRSGRCRSKTWLFLRCPAAPLRCCAAALLLVCHCIVLHRCGVVRLHLPRCAAVGLRCC